MLKSTPGPWSAFIGKNGTVAIDIGAKPSGTTPCIVNWTGFSDSDLSVDECRANARLIAAAPDLLAALNRILASDTNISASSDDELEAATFDPYTTLLVREQAAAVLQARAAIAKATGAA